MKKIDSVSPFPAFAVCRGRYENGQRMVLTRCDNMLSTFGLPGE